MSSTKPDMPPKGSRWRHPRLRGTWTVAIVGTKYVTLSSSLPISGPRRVLAERWPRDFSGGDWEPA